MYRTGLGQDSHSFTAVNEKKPLILGGVKIADIGGLKGNSDSDVILHSICNALSSAIGGDSLSTWADKMCKEQSIKDSARYVGYILNKAEDMGYTIINVSISVEAKKPRLEMVIIKSIKNKIASLLKIETDQVGLTFTSGEHLTAFGQGLGIQVLTLINIKKYE